MSKQTDLRSHWGKIKPGVDVEKKSYDSTCSVSMKAKNVAKTEIQFQTSKLDIYRLFLSPSVPKTCGSILQLSFASHKINYTFISSSRRRRYVVI
jgi:hypothetical protein